MNSVLPLQPPSLEWRDVTLDLGEFAVRDLSLRVAPGSWLCLVGPTGAGKSIVLEIAAGFLRPTSGHVFRDGVDVTTAPPERRRIGYVPQDDLLFPHLDVRANLLYAVRGERMPPRPARRLWTRLTDSRRDAPAAQLDALATDLGISHVLGRRIHAISGGEAQRVALGRTLLSGCDLLLLDECTSALDEEMRAGVGRLLLAEQERRGLTVVQVTHDPEEATRLADVVVTLAAGRITRVDVPNVPRRSGGTP